MAMTGRGFTPTVTVANALSIIAWRPSEAVFVAAADAVPWRARDASEAWTTRSLDGLVPGDAAPVPYAAGGARRRLAAARLRAVAAAKGEP